MTEVAGAVLGWALILCGIFIACLGGEIVELRATICLTLGTLSIETARPPR